MYQLSACLLYALPGLAATETREMPLKPGFCLRLIARRLAGAPRHAAMACVAVLVPLIAGEQVGGQHLQGDWVDQAEARIDELRKVDSRLVVLDSEGRPAAGVPVRVRQLRHAFAFGVRLDAEALLDAGRPHPLLRDEPDAVWRCFNAMSLAASPTVDDAELDRLRQGIAAARARGLAVRLGPVVQSDAARLPPGLSDEPQPLIRAAATLLRAVGADADGIDLLTGTIDRDTLGPRFGVAFYRRLYHEANAAAPRAPLAAHFADAFSGQRLHKLGRHVIAMREAFIPIEAVAVGVSTTGVLAHGQVARSLEWLAGMDLPVTIVDLEAGGPSPAAAAVNLETCLRLMFASPHVTGIHFRGVTETGLADPSAALRREGEPTPAGQVVEHLLRELWWTDERATSDGLGNVRRRVFAGEYELSAELPDGTRAELRVWLDAEAPPDLIVLQPVRRGE